MCVPMLDGYFHQIKIGIVCESLLVLWYQGSALYQGSLSAEAEEMQLPGQGETGRRVSLRPHVLHTLDEGDEGTVTAMRRDGNGPLNVVLDLGRSAQV